MNKLKGDCFIGHDTRILYTNTRGYIQIFSLVAGNLSSTHPAYKREYLYIRRRSTLVKLYNKANV